MRRLATAFLFFQFGQDPIRQHELRERALRGQIQTAEPERVAREVRQRKLFEQRFNRLVAAVESFAREYNKSKGRVWSMKEADELRAAMEQLQQIEPNLKSRRITR